MTITVYDSTGNKVTDLIAEKGSKQTASLMERDLITIKTSQAEPISIEPGYYTTIDSKKYVVTERSYPTYNTATGAWDYEITMDAWYMSWQRYIFRLNPTNGATSTSFGYTNTFAEHLRILMIHLSYLHSQDATIEMPTSIVVHYRSQNGSSYREKLTTYTFANGTLSGSSRYGATLDTYSNETDLLVGEEIRYVAYNNLKIIDAINMMCSEDAFSCEWWMTGKTLNFGRCATSDATLSIRNDVHAVISRSASANEHATRLIAFGSTTNMPARYRKKLIFQITNIEQLGTTTTEDEMDIQSQAFTIRGGTRQTFTLYTFVPKQDSVSIDLSIPYVLTNASGYEMRLRINDTEVASTGSGPVDNGSSVTGTLTASRTGLSVPLEQESKIILEILTGIDGATTDKALYINQDGSATGTIKTTERATGYRFTDINRRITSSLVGGTITYPYKRTSTKFSETFQDIPAGKARIQFDLKGKFQSIRSLTDAGVYVVCYDSLGNIAESRILYRVSQKATINTEYTITGDVETTILGGNVDVVFRASYASFVISGNLTKTIHYGGRKVTTTMYITDAAGNKTGATKQVVFNRNMLMDEKSESGWMSAADNSGISVGTHYVLDDIDEEEVDISYFTDNYGEANIASYERRLMLPIDTCPKNYIDATTDNNRIVEAVKTFDDVYPKMDVSIARVEWYKERVENNVNGETYFTYPVRFDIFLRKSELNFQDKYIVSGQKLQMQFQTGLLSGYTFDLEFDGNVDTRNAAEPGTELQRYRIVTSQAYGVDLPNASLAPSGSTVVTIQNTADTTPDTGTVTEKTATADHIVLLNYSQKGLTALGLVAQAENELYRQAKAYLDKISSDEGTYTLTMFHTFFESRSPFGLGQSIRLEANGCVPTTRTTRVIGYDIALDIPIDSPVYTVGETKRYSRLAAMSKKKMERLEAHGGYAAGSIYQSSPVIKGSGIKADGLIAIGPDTPILTNKLRWAWGSFGMTPAISDALVKILIARSTTSASVNTPEVTVKGLSWKSFVVVYPTTYTLTEFSRIDVYEDWLVDTDYTYTYQVNNVTYNGETADYMVVVRRVLATVKSSQIKIAITNGS